MLLGAERKIDRGSTRMSSNEQNIEVKTPEGVSCSRGRVIGGATGV